MKLDFFKKFLKAVDDALFPKDITCDACGGELVADTRYRLCAKCMENLPRISGHICEVCGAPLSGEGEYCLRCQKQESLFVRSRSPLVYEGVAKELIYAMKFSGRKYINDTLAAMMADCFLANKMEADVIVFVPMTAKEERKRGFNQSELLANNLGERLNSPVLPALLKLKDTPPQKELNREEREKNLDGAFKCIFDEVKKLNVLLVDDVFTTGVTANECTKALLKAKAKSVQVLTAAVTVLKLQEEITDDDKKEWEHEQKLELDKQDVKIELVEE